MKPNECSVGTVDPIDQFHLDIVSGKLVHQEPFWALYQPFFLSRGYKLRSRYTPGWVPSWKDLPEPDEIYYKFEDSLIQKKGHLLDAIRIADGRKVVFKRVQTTTDELPIACYLSSKPLKVDPRNNAVPILDVLLQPDDDRFAFLVMPLLFPLNILPFRRVEEFTEAVRQYLQGLDFMHEHNIAHRPCRDPCLHNLMMDATELLPEGFHFLNPFTYDGINTWSEWRERRKDKGLRYYFIDFDLSQRYRTNTNIKNIGIYGQDQTCPELSLTVPFDPFKTDIYQLGNVIVRLGRVYDGLRHFVDIGMAMTRPIPEDRISLSEALQRVSRLSRFQLRRRIWKKDEPFFIRFLIQFCGQDFPF